jgi:phage terminase small subunit
MANKDLRCKPNLNERQKLFCAEYLKDFNGTHAARRAGYKADNSHIMANYLLKLPKVADRIELLMKRREERTLVQSDKVLKELAIIAFSRITDFLKVRPIDSDDETDDDEDEDLGEDLNREPAKNTYKFVDIFDTDSIPEELMAAVQSIKQTKYGVEIRLHDKLKALELIMRHLGMMEKDNPNVFNVVAPLNQDQVKLLLEEIRKK